MENFYIDLAEILEVDEVRPNDVLQDFENWDSLTILSILATLDASYGVTLPAADLRRIKSVGELAEMVDSRRRK